MNKQDIINELQRRIDELEETKNTHYSPVNQMWNVMDGMQKGYAASIRLIGQSDLISASDVADELDAIRTEYMGEKVYPANVFAYIFQRFIRKGWKA